MSRHRLHTQIARATGESLRTIRSQGFSLLTLAVPTLDPPARLCLACPGCGMDVSLSDDEGELPEWAECAKCDIAYPYADEEVFLPDAELAVYA
ncbi:MAG: hypothetical protein AABP62_14890 [Planctomycetota bacterium]